jgi:Ni/Co efflux regulator RcnB
MKSKMKQALQGLVLATAGIATVAQAQPYGGQYDQRDHRDRGDSDRDNHDRDHRDRGDYRWHNYGGRYGYNGYQGRWRTGQRFDHYRDNRYWVQDYRSYNLPPPRPGYRYYRDDSGDIVMVAIASGIIGAILGSAISGDHHH